MRNRIAAPLLALTIIVSSTALAGGKLLGTSGVGSLEGAAGGGLIPWAPLAGYATQDEWTGTAAISRVDISDFTMSSVALATNYQDRVELSVARMEFQAKAGGESIRQNITGLKVRLLGDLIYGTAPIISVGVQHKSLLDTDTALAVGAKDTSGTDFYISAARAWLDGPAGRTVFLNINLRNTEANQLGLLGFGSDSGDREWVIEAAAALYFNRYWAAGVEYREKPDNLSSFEEEDWAEVFVAHFPSKSVSLTAAYLELGDIAGQSDQSALYFSLQGAF